MALSSSAYGRAIVPGSGGVTSLSAFSNQMNNMARQDRQHELNMRELEYMAARQALGAGIPGQAGGGSSNADAFLNKWQQQLGKVEGVYNQALSGLQGTYGDLRTASGAANKLGDLAGRIEQEYQGYLGEMKPLQQEMTGMAMEEAGVRRGLMSQLPALTAYDPEGAAGRAIADVSQQFGQARQSEARRMAAMGIDPTSGAGRAGGRQWAAAEALGRATGATGARLAERNRATGVTMQGLSLLDPSRAATTALNIRQGANQLLGQSANLLTAQAQSLGNLASTRANIGRSIADIGGSMAQSMANPYAEMAGLQMGLAGQKQLDAQAVLGSMQSRPRGGGFGASPSYDPNALAAQRIGSPMSFGPGQLPIPGGGMLSQAPVNKGATFANTRTNFA